VLVKVADVPVVVAPGAAAAAADEEEEEEKEEEENDDKEAAAEAAAEAISICVLECPPAAVAVVRAVAAVAVVRASAAEVSGGTNEKVEAAAEAEAAKEAEEDNDGVLLVVVDALTGIPTSGVAAEETEDEEGARNLMGLLSKNRDIDETMTRQNLDVRLVCFFC
jgi:hypothetical protein